MFLENSRKTILHRLGKFSNEETNISKFKKWFLLNLMQSKMLKNDKIKI